jgi:hypothetical protein
MAYSRFDTTKPAGSQTGSAFAASANTNDAALLDMIGCSLMDGHAYSQSGGTAEEPTTVLFTNGARILKAALTWASGNITAVTFSLSVNSGSSYDTIGSPAALTYDGSGNLTASTNFGGMLLKVWEWIGKVKALRTLFNAHVAATGIAVHGLQDMALQDNAAVNIDGGTIDGTAIGGAVQAPINAQVSRELVVAKGSISGATPIDWSAGGYQTMTVGAAATLSFTNLPTTGLAQGLTLEITNGAAFTLTWPAGIKWPSASAPTLTTSGVDIVELVCRDGSTVRGALAQKDSR